MNIHKRQNFKKRYGEWAVITGASSGIGRASAVELAGIGLNLVLIARHQAELEKLARELSDQHGVQTRVVASDLATLSGIKNVATEAKDLDVGLLVTAAGFGTTGPFLEATIEDEFAMLDVNCRAVLALSLHFGRRLAQRGRGGVVLFGSLVGFQGTPHAAHYAATKAYIQTLGEALHLELARQGVDVLVSAPGPVKSGFAARARMEMGASRKPRDSCACHA